MDDAEHCESILPLTFRVFWECRLCLSDSLAAMRAGMFCRLPIRRRDHRLKSPVPNPLKRYPNFTTTHGRPSRTGDCAATRGGIQTSGDAGRCTHTLQGLASRLRVYGLLQAGPRRRGDQGGLRGGGRTMYSRVFRIFGWSALILSATAATWFPQAALAVSKVKIAGTAKVNITNIPSVNLNGTPIGRLRAGARWRSNRVARCRSSPAPPWGWNPAPRCRYSRVVPWDCNREARSSWTLRPRYRSRMTPRVRPSRRRSPYR
jgi:hypothetical protein